MEKVQLINPQMSSQNTNIVLTQSQFKISSNNFMNDDYRKKIIPQHMIYGKEDLYDQNLHVKSQMNDVREENLKLKTKLQIVINQLKDKDKLVEELFQSAFITSSGTQAKNNLDKNIQMIVRLKKLVNDLKDTVCQKSLEIVDLKRNIKVSRANEYEMEINVYKAECQRLRAICENSIKISGELDLDKLNKERQIVQAQLKIHSEQSNAQINNHLSNFNKLQNAHLQTQEDHKVSQQQAEAHLKEIHSLKEKINKMNQIRHKELEKDEELHNKANKDNIHLHEQIKYLEEQVDEQKNQTEQITQSLSQQIKEKENKIEELCDELLQKDQQIDSQAILNKERTKQCDQLDAYVIELNKKITNDQEQIIALKESMAKLQKLEDKDHQLGLDLQHKIETLKNDLAALKTENSELKIESHNKTKDLVQEVKELKADQQDLQDKLSHALIENVQSNKRFKDFQEKTKNCVIPVKREDKLVQFGLQRLKTICQLQGYKLDQIQDFIFGQDMGIQKKITINELAQIFKHKLEIPLPRALFLSRFLIEPERDETDMNEVEFDGHLAVNAISVCNKLMLEIGQFQVYLNYEPIAKSAIERIIFQFKKDDLIEQLGEMKREMTFNELQNLLDRCDLLLNQDNQQFLFLAMINVSDQEGNYETIKSERLISFIKGIKAHKNDASIVMTDSDREKRASLNVPRSHNNLPQLKVNLSDPSGNSQVNQGAADFDKIEEQVVQEKLDEDGSESDDLDQDRDSDNEQTGKNQLNPHEETEIFGNSRQFDDTDNNGGLNLNAVIKTVQNEEHKHSELELIKQKEREELLEKERLEQLQAEKEREEEIKRQQEQQLLREKEAKEALIKKQQEEEQALLKKQQEEEALKKQQEEQKSQNTSQISERSQYDLEPEEIIKKYVIEKIRRQNSSGEFNQDVFKNAAFTLKNIFTAAAKLMVEAAHIMKQRKFAPRDLFYERIYNICDKERGLEVEVITKEEFMFIFKRNVMDMNEEQQKAFYTVVEDDIIDHSLLNFKEISTLFGEFLVKEKIPISKPHLDYTLLDMKSIRIINRFYSYMATNNTSLVVVFKDIIQDLTVKTKSNNPTVQVIQAENFFLRLQELNVRKSGEIHDNLCKFLCIDKTYTQILMVKKIKRAILDFSNSDCYKQIGEHKRQKPSYSISNVQGSHDFGHMPHNSSDMGSQFRFGQNINTQKDSYRSGQNGLRQHSDGGEGLQLNQDSLQGGSVNRNLPQAKHLTNKSSYGNGQGINPNFNQIQENQEEMKSEYEYYDEEVIDDAIEQSHILDKNSSHNNTGIQQPQVQQQNQQLPEQIHQDENLYKVEQKGHSSKNNTQKTNNQQDEEYEYYDEEIPEDEIDNETNIQKQDTKTQQKEEVKKPEKQPIVYKSGGELKMILKRAQCDINADIFKMMDPYVIVDYDGMKNRTEVAQGQGKNPVWDQQITLQILGDADPNEMIKITVMDDDIDEDDRVGYTELMVSDLIQGEQNQDEHTYALYGLQNGQNVGKIVIVHTYEQFDKSPAKPQQDLAQPQQQTQQKEESEYSYYEEDIQDDTAQQQQQNQQQNNQVTNNQQQQNAKEVSEEIIEDDDYAF